MSIPDDKTTEAKLGHYAKADECKRCGHYRKDHSDGNCRNCPCGGMFVT